MDNQQVTFHYTNYRGETAVRRVTPKRVWFGATPEHPEIQWFLDAWDHVKSADRSFAMKDICDWEAV